MKPPSYIPLEQMYGRAILRLIRKYEKLILEAAEEIAKDFPEEVTDRTDADNSKKILNQLRRQLQKTIEPRELERLSQRFVKKVSDKQHKFLKKQVRQAIGIDVVGSDENVAGVFKGLVDDNVRLIRDIPEATVEKISEMTQEAVQKGMSRRKFTEGIEKVMKISRNRARLIARDQIGKAASQITRTRHKAIGLRGFYWRTMQDERVRPEHEDLEGERFSYEGGGHEIEGFPGEPVLCRCYEEPDFSSIL